MSGILELGASGWLLAGESWQPEKPFYAVLGRPVAHSLSPRMQNAALAERELDHQYHRLEITPGRLRHLKEGGPGRWLAGFNVTAPLKEAVAALCDGRTDQARSLGVVNTVKVEDGRWLGHNTDSGGILMVLSEAWGERDLPIKGVVLGAGGSARAAVDALLRWGVETIEVRNRSAAGREKFRHWLKDRKLEDQVVVRGLNPEPPDPLSTPQVWVGCVAGGVPVADYLPRDTGKKKSMFLDLRYGRQLPTEVLPAGMFFSDGLPVLLMQGGLSFAWWFGPPIPWQAMRAALDED